MGWLLQQRLSSGPHAMALTLFISVLWSSSFVFFFFFLIFLYIYIYKRVIIDYLIWKLLTHTMWQKQVVWTLFSPPLLPLAAHCNLWLALTCFLEKICEPLYSAYVKHRKIFWCVLRYTYFFKKNIYTYFIIVRCTIHWSYKNVHFLCF